MAGEAQKEPTMEEILASIRRIISEDDGAPKAEPCAAEPAAEKPLSPQDILGRSDQLEDDAASQMASEAMDLELDDGLDDLDAVEDAFADDGDADLDDDPVEDPTAFGIELEEGAFDDEDEFNAELLTSAPGSDAEVPPMVPDEPEPVAFEETIEPVEETVFRPVPEPVHEPEPEPEPVAKQVETETMSAALKTDEGLIDDTAATAAAGAMAKLMGRMDLGSNNTLEGVVRDMLKPMIKEWLDANLPRIVEQKVEAEVQRIARLAG